MSILRLAKLGRARHPANAANEYKRTVIVSESAGPNPLHLQELLKESSLCAA